MPPRRAGASRPVREWRHVLIGIGIAFAFIAVGAVLWTSSGLYHVGASRPHWKVTEAFIAFGLQRSVATHSLTMEVPEPGSPELGSLEQIRLGAAQFEIGCASCHGSPDASPATVTSNMLPAPPHLDGVAQKWDPAELAWIVQNGLKYTGMPAWPAPERQDEIWPLVAFLRDLPMPAEEYRALVGRFAAENDLANPGFCESCHGGGAPNSGLAPPLAGQSELYLRRALSEFATGARRSGYMEPIARALSAAEIESLASAFAKLPRSSASPSVAKAHKRGEGIAAAGSTSGDVPACLACHDGGARPDYPKLAGLPAAYIAGQLRLWQRGGRSNTDMGALMAPIARRLTPQQIADLAAYFSALEQAP